MTGAIDQPRLGRRVWTAWLILAAAAAAIAAGALLLVKAMFAHADVIRTVRANGPRAVSFPTPADHFAWYALIAVIVALLLTAVAVIVVWFSGSAARRPAVTISLVVMTLMLPSAGLAFAVTAELRSALHKYQVDEVRHVHPNPKTGPIGGP
jgi:hypothetical protein